MARIDELRTELKQLEGLERWAGKLRGKSGRLEVSQETFDELEDSLGHELPVSEEPDGRLMVRMETLVAAIDAKLAK